MQTFLPYSDFSQTAWCLDRRRLGKQRVEVLQILRTIHGESAGWIHHPAVRMWTGYENALVKYGQAICTEWLARGYKDTCLSKISAYAYPLSTQMSPRFVFNQDFLNSHRSNLLRKDLQWYSQFGWNVSNDLPYIWT